MKFTIDLDLKPNILINSVLINLINEAVINAALKHHIKMLDVCKIVDMDKLSIESTKIIEYHTTWVDLLEKATVTCEGI